MQTNPPWPRYNKDGGRPPARCISICERYPMRTIVKILARLLSLALAGALSHWPAHLSRTENEIRSLLLRTLLLKLRQDVEAATERRSFQPVTASGSPLARRARQLIDAAAPEHFPGLPEIAARLGCSPNHLSMVFHREHGETVKNYVTGLKLRYAHRMLEDSDFNISEIAARCGFADPGYFARVFRKRFGRSPSAVR